MQEPLLADEPLDILVTGAGGFVGGALAARLKAAGHRVRSFSRGSYPQLEAQNIVQHRGDLSDAAAVHKACEGCQVIFHVAAMAGIWGRKKDFWQTNVVGSQNIVAAAIRAGVPTLVYTSSPSVVHHGSVGITGQSELEVSYPAPKTYTAAYPKTKAMAEQAVLAANSNVLSTVALRPHLVWGPGDRHLLPRLVAKAQAGKLIQVGEGCNRVDTAFIDNVIDAHILAAQSLHAARMASQNAAAAGKAYFIAQDDPIPLWDMVDALLQAAGAPRPKKKISAKTAYRVGAALEMIHKVLLPWREPAMTRFVAQQLTSDHFFDLGAAKRDLGYAPRVSTEEGLGQLKGAWEHSAL